MNLLLEIGAVGQPWLDYKSLIIIVSPFLVLVIGHLINSNRKAKEDFINKQDEKISSIVDKIDSVITRLDNMNEAFIRTQEKGDTVDKRSVANSEELTKIKDEVQTMKRQIALLEQTYNKK